MSPDKTEVKQDKFVYVISLAKVHIRETYKSQNIKKISLTPNFTLGIIQIKNKCLPIIFQWLVE